MEQHCDKIWFWEWKANLWNQKDKFELQYLGEGEVEDVITKNSEEVEVFQHNGDCLIMLLMLKK
jgi:hypothetical protein